MSVQDQLMADLRIAMKARDSIRVETIRMVRAALQNAEIEVGGELNEGQVAQVLDKEAKKRREAAEAYEQAGRTDLAEKERAELQVVAGYLPEQLSEEELTAMVAAAIEQAGATSRQDMGAVMKALMPQVRGRADGKLVSRLVTERLSS